MNIDIKELPILTVGDTAIDTSNLENEEEIMRLINIAYEIADDLSLTGTRTPNDIDNIEQLKKELENNLRESQKETEDDRLRSVAVQSWAEKQREKIDQSLKTEKLEKMKRIHDALKYPKVGYLLLKVMNKTLTQQQAFAAINSNPGLQKQMMSLTLKGTGTRNGGKSRVFRRKNKKTRSKSRRNAQRTQRTRRHRKSSTRRSTRK